MRLILETHTKRFEHAPTFDIDAFVAVNKNIADARIFEQRFKRAKPRHLIDDFSNEIIQFLRIQRQPLCQNCQNYCDTIFWICPCISFSGSFFRACS